MPSRPKQTPPLRQRCEWPGDPFVPVFFVLSLRCLPLSGLDSVDRADRHSATPPPYSPNGEESTVVQTACCDTPPPRGNPEQPFLRCRRFGRGLRAEWWLRDGG